MQKWICGNINEKTKKMGKKKKKEILGLLGWSLAIKLGTREVSKSNFTIIDY